MRILATADIHLGSPIRSLATRNPDLGGRVVRASEDVLARIIDLAISTHVDVIVLAGDLFDSGAPDIRLLAVLRRQLARAFEAGIHSVLIRGNHDAHVDHTRFGDMGEGVHLLDRARPTALVGDVAFHGISFETSHAERSFLPMYPAPDLTRRNVGVMHTSLGGAVGHDPYAPCSEADLLQHGYDLWCLGHIHKPFDRGESACTLVMPGVPQPRHFGESEGGQVAICTLGEGPTDVVRHDVARLRFQEVTLVAQTAEVLTDTLSKVAQEYSQAGIDTALRMVVQSDRFTREDVQAFAELALEGVSNVFLDKVIMARPAAAMQEAPDDLERLMRTEMGTPAFALLQDTVLQELRDALPADLRNSVDTQTLLEDAVADVLRAVKGVG